MPDSPESEPISEEGTLYSINLEEIHLKTAVKLDFKHLYNIKFSLFDSEISVNGHLLMNQQDSGLKFYYYTLRFAAISESGKNQILKFVTDHS